MIHKKIRKFFNSVTIYENLPVLYEEKKKKKNPLFWIAASIAAIIAAVGILCWVMDDDAS